MDHRIALKPNTQLRLHNDKGEAICCVIESELGRGGSCIVYEASRLTDTGDKTLFRVKEFYPYKLHISRDESNALVPSDPDAPAFFQEQEQLRSDFSRTNRLFYSGTNYSSMINQLDVFSQNGTSYILSAYSSKKTLASYKPETLKGCIALVKQTAHVLDNIHKQGYLYLDVKPDNILMVDGYPKQIQLFDFDSLLPIPGSEQTHEQICGNMRLSYSKGFAPIELQTAKVKHLGPHSDAYSVGALLFYLLFGRTPAAPDCEMDATYDFSRISYDYHKCDDHLFRSLAEFFHNALAVYYADRYHSMQEVIAQLQEIEKYADPMIPRIYSTQIARPKIFYGRDREFEELDQLLTDPDHNCLFLTGMGGIGKSAFIREYLTRRKDRFDVILYVHYKGSTGTTISDDRAIEINTLRQEEETWNTTRYFDKKVQKIRELVRGTSSILVMDNFTGEMDDDLRALLSTELKVVLLGRKALSYQSCREMSLSAVSDPASLRHIFESNLGRSITLNEQKSFQKIVKYIQGHTLALELIAKQIANSHITLSRAASLTEGLGFSSIAPERIDYEKDSVPASDTIGNIIDALFSANNLSTEKRSLLKVSSLLGDDSIGINDFQQIMNLPSKDDLNDLIKGGWLTLSGDTISMHHVIWEAVHRWEWASEYIAAAEQFLTYFYMEIRLEATKNNYPKKLQRQLSAVIANPKRRKRMDRTIRWLEKKSDAKDLSEKVCHERLSRIQDGSPSDIDKLTKLLALAESIISQCQREQAIYDTVIFTDFEVTVLLYMPRYREDFIFSEISRILAENILAIGAGYFSAYAKAKNDLKQDAPTIMRLYELVFSIYAAHGDKVAMKDLLDHAGKLARKSRQRITCGIYYNMVANYCDALLDGAYDTEGPGEEALLNRMLDAIDKTLRYSKQDISLDEHHLYAETLLTKATIFMRSGCGIQKDILVLLKKAQKVIFENTSSYADVRLHYYLVCAWYFALMCDNTELAERYIKEARELSDIIIPTDLQKIEDVYIPCANIFYELGCHRKAMDLLFEGTQLCAQHINADAYARTRQGLYDHLLEVGMDAQNFELCKRILKLARVENKEILDSQNRVVISDEIRDIVEGHIA